MTDKHLHIVTHDVPWPAEHGGFTDLFYKLKALHNRGINIHLHCFTSGRSPQAALDRYCASVNYYDRKKNISGFSFRLPFIVNSRKNPSLAANLQKDNYPVLLEGIHTTYCLFNGMLTNRKILVRLHNTEFEYYRKLAKPERNIFKKYYLLLESRLLKKYERAIANKAVFLAVSTIDVKRYQDIFKAKDIHYLPVFTPYTLASGKEGKGNYCLYHGNLSVIENEQAATWLLDCVFNDLEIPFVIAGKNPSGRLQKMAHRYRHTCLVANPTASEMQDLVARAQLHIIPSFNSTGIKLKLLNAFFNGRHCLVNRAAVEGSGLEQYCYSSEGATAFKKKTTELFQLYFTQQAVEERQGLLLSEFNNERNAKKLVELIWGEL